MVVMSEKHSILRDTTPAPSSFDAQGPSEKAPTVRGADTGDFYTECIERSNNTVCAAGAAAVFFTSRVRLSLLPLFSALLPHTPAAAGNAHQCPEGNGACDFELCDACL